MGDFKYASVEEVLITGRTAIGVPLRELDKTGRLMIGKGAIGSIVEESVFKYEINSISGPDIPDVGVEVKVTPFLRGKNNQIKAKERLVCNIINYMTEYENSFYTSSFWMKCSKMLLMFYEHRTDVEKGDLFIEEVSLFSFPLKDLYIIKNDWETIINKIRKGKAHEISEGDTMYLGACTKGANSESVRPQPFSKLKAKQRAYALKQSYMTYILNHYIFGKETDENIIMQPSLLEEKKFEDIIYERIKPYFGMTQASLLEMFQISAGSKNANELIISRILGIRGKLSKTEEFRKANMVPKTIVIQENGKIRESMSFSPYKSKELIQENWENSILREMLIESRFMFIIFRKIEGILKLDDVMFWNFPEFDLDEVKTVWENTVETLNRGVRFTTTKKGVENDLPKASQSKVAHVRPHARDANDTDVLPDGRLITKQSFWLNNNYIAEQIIRLRTERN